MYPEDPLDRFEHDPEHRLVWLQAVPKLRPEPVRLQQLAFARLRSARMDDRGGDDEDWEAREQLQ